MRNSRAILVVAIVFGLIISVPEFADAQCSMCRAVTNSNQLADDAFTVGNGLNNGIMYMMAIPYLFGAIFAYAFFGKQIRAWFRKGLS